MTKLSKFVISALATLTLGMGMTVGCQPSEGGGGTAGHTHTGEWITEKEPTCTEAGSRTRQCTECNQTETEVIPALGHDMQKHAKQPPTCTAPGYEAYEQCSRCGEYAEPLQTIPETGHNFKDGVCLSCGAPEVTDGLEYSPNADGTGYVLTSLGTCTERVIDIAADIDGLPVTEIGEGAFFRAEGIDFIERINLPSSIKTIGVGAFRNLTSLNEISLNEGLVTIGDMAFYNCGYLPSIKIPSTVKTIGYGAFYQCYSIDNVVIPDTVTEMGGAAFYSCIGLQTVSIGDGIKKLTSEQYAGFFQGCTSLKSVDLGQVEEIGEYAFMDCEGLTQIVIPQTVTAIDTAAFTNCTSLSDITVHEGIEHIGQYAFYNTAYQNNVANAQPNGLVYLGDYYLISATATAEGNVQIKDGTTLIADFAFNSIVVEYSNGTTDVIGASITGVNIPASVKSIGTGAFYKCDKLQSIVIPDTVEKLGGAVFYKCSELAQVKLSSKITSFPDYTTVTQDLFETSTISYGMFQDCTQLQQIEFPSNFEYIGRKTFAGCTGMTQINIPNSVTYLAGDSFDGCTGLQKLVIGSGVEKFGDGNDNHLYLTDCSSLKEIEVDPQNEHFSSQDGVLYNKNKTELYKAPQNVNDGVTIPSGVEMIEQAAFFKCFNLTSINLPDSVTQLGPYVFSTCINLTTAVLGTGVTALPDMAFEFCNRLQSVQFKGNLTEIGDYAFYMAPPKSSDGKKYNLPEPALTEITLPASLTRIGNRAFYNCLNLKTINYDGSSQQWELIEKGVPLASDTKNEEVAVGYWDWAYDYDRYYNYRMAYTVHCNNEDIKVTSVRFKDFSDEELIPY